MSNIHTYIVVDPLDGMAHRRVSAVLSEITDSSETMVVDTAVRFTSGCDAGQWSSGSPALELIPSDVENDIRHHRFGSSGDTSLKLDRRTIVLRPGIEPTNPDNGSCPR
jgi:hypothetical protein